MDLELTCRFLLSTHYSHYDVWMFTVNCWALMMVLIPKLPSVYLPSQAILTRVFSSTECGFSESTNSISRNHPITTNKPLDSLLHLYFMASKAYIRSLSRLSSLGSLGMGIQRTSSNNVRVIRD